MKREATVEQLVDRARQGDRDAFDLLVSRSRDRLRDSVEKWTRFQLGPRLEVDDVLQETYLRAYRSLARFDPVGQVDDESFLRWTCGIAKHAIGDLLRKKRVREQPVSSIERAASGPSASGVLRREERFGRLADAIAKLPADYRQVLELSRLEGLPAEEIAERMGRTPNAVYHLIVRALKALRETFGDTASLHLPDRQLPLEGVGGDE